MMSSSSEYGVFGWDFCSEIPSARRTGSIEAECIEYYTSRVTMNLVHLYRSKAHNHLPLFIRK